MALSVAEMFYSIQGEGRWAGVPAVFLRLAGCNLGCPGWSYVEPPENPDLREFSDPPLRHLGCDTKLVWERGKPMTNIEIISDMVLRGWTRKLALGLQRCHLVVTGGEPFLQQGKLYEFLEQLYDEDGMAQMYIEIETNGTLVPGFEMNRVVSHYNISPKLSNSGEPEEKRVNNYAITALADAFASKCWKFVVNSESDIDEIMDTYVNPYKLRHQEVYLMPEGGTRESLSKNSSLVAELCKTHNFRYSPRLHIDIWDEATGV